MVAIIEITAILLLCAGVRAKAAGNTQSRTICVTQPGGKALEFGACELCRYLKLMTGDDYTLTHDSSEPCLITLLIEHGLKPDGYRIRSREGVISISGGSSRGCMYGVYRLLYELGCRWPLPGQQYEVVPKRSRISWARPMLKSEPAIRRRGVSIYVSDSDIEPVLEMVDYMAKNGYNLLYFHWNGNSSDTMSNKQLIDAMSLREMGFEFGGHLLPGLLPRELSKTSPEFFRMENGVRTPNLNMCSSSQGAADVMATNAQKYVDIVTRYSNPETLHLYSDDLLSGGWCSCPLCAKLTEPDQAVKILNSLVERLKLGGIMLGYPAYRATLVPPVSVQPSSKIRLAFGPRERCYRHALGECKSNKAYLQHYKNLIKAFPNQPLTFDYYGDMILFRWLPVPLHPIIGRDVQAYIKAGVDAISPLWFERYSNWAYGPNFYVLGKAMWRGKSDPKDIEDYCTAVYGPVARNMKHYFDMLFELTATAMETCGYALHTDLRGAPVDQPFASTHAAQLKPLISYKHSRKIESLLAQSLAGASEPYRSRVQEQHLLFEYTKLETNNIYTQIRLTGECVEAPKDTSTDEDRQGVIDDIEASIPLFYAGINRASSMILSAPLELAGRIVREDMRPNEGMDWKPTDLMHLRNQLLAKIAANKKPSE